MNQEKLKQLQAQVRIGGKGTARRKKKVVHRTATTDDKKLQSSLKKLSVNSIPGIEEVNMIKDDGTVIHFNNPKVQASLAANTFAVTGHGENKQITDLLPGILNQLGAESLTHLKKLASNVPSADGLDGGMEAGKDDDDDDVPDLVENFDEASKNETTVENVTDAVEKVEIAEDKDEATKTETNSEIVPDASEIVPNAVEKVEIAEEGIVLKDEASKNDTSGENVTDALAKTEITEEDKEDKVEDDKDSEDSDELGFLNDAGVEPLV